MKWEAALFTILFGAASAEYPLCKKGPLNPHLFFFRMDSFNLYSLEISETLIIPAGFLEFKTMSWGVFKLE